MKPWKLLEENIGNIRCDFGLSNLYIYIYIFLIHLLRQGNKSKNKQMEPNQAKNLLHSEGSHQQKEKASYWIGENTCK